MHPSFRQSVAYMVPKQEQCVSDIIEVAPPTTFQFQVTWFQATWWRLGA